MFSWAVATGIFTYYIFFLGLIGELEYPYILLGVIAYIGYSYYVVQQALSWTKVMGFLRPLTRFERIILVVIVAHIGTNLVGTLGPEIAFDAVWYHLTIPRIWLLEEQIFYIQHGPFSYSLLPKLLDLLYVAALAVSDEIGAKVIHWFFGILCGVVTYKMARHFMERKYALLSVLVLFSNLVFGWQSITAYIDLGRTFFESLAVWALLYATKEDSPRWRYIAATMVGLAILSKLIAITSLAALVLIFILQRKYLEAFLSFCIALIIPSPWFSINYLQTSNPIFPVFSGYDLTSTSSLFDAVTIWFRSADPLSPIYAILMPLVILFFTSYNAAIFTAIPRYQKKIFRLLVLYTCLVFIFWILTPRTGGGRFILPYLPAFSVLSIYILSLTKARNISKIAVSMVLVIGVFSLMYRAAANAKYLPVLIGVQSTEDFLQSNLPKNFGNNWYYLQEDSLKALYKQQTQTNELQWEYK